MEFLGSQQLSEAAVHGEYSLTRSCMQQPTDSVRTTSLEKGDLEVFTGEKPLMVFR
jgi:hypothetical protein